MRLTLHTDYCLRVLIYAALKGNALSTVGEIAKRFGISRNHLMKVVHQLGLKGYLETIRGRGGGIRLARPPAEICVGAVVRDTEDELDVVGCLNNPGFCVIERHCMLQTAVHEATGAFLAVLDRYTLDMLLQPGTAMGRQLAIDLDLDRRSPERRQVATR